jgi:hypothetical protein
MGLVSRLADIGTEYRKLKFGNDRPGGGDSKQPFIKQDLPSLESEQKPTFPDFLLRDPKNALNDRKDDLERISKFLISREGGLFVAKQELLSLTNPIVPGQPNRSKPFNGLYNPLLTLTQVGASGTGLHVERQGTFPIFDEKLKYEYVYKNNFSDETTNRLTILYNNKIDQQNVERINLTNLNFRNLFTNAGLTIRQIKRKLNIPSENEKAVGVAADPNLILSYSGGPNAGANGVGKTNIGFADNRVYSAGLNDEISKKLTLVSDKIKEVNSGLYLPNYFGATTKSLQLGYGLSLITNSSLNANGNGFNFQPSVYTQGNTFPETNKQKTTDLGVYTFTQNQLINQNPIGDDGSTSLSNITDFRQTILDNTIANPGADNNLYSFNYKNNRVNREQRVGLGNPGKRTRDRVRLNSYDNSTVDRINILPLYKSTTVADPDVLTRDLVKFRFEVIDNQNPGESTFIHFRAFLGAITDNFSSEWDSFRYVGRGEKFYNYQGFSREISFNFKVAPQSRAEMKSLYQKLNYLAASLSPDYNNGYMKGNLIRLTIGDYLYIVPGFISNLTYTIPEDAPWEIAFDSPEDGETLGLMETPKLIEVNVNFTPIHDFAARLGDTKQTAYITPQAPESKNKYLGDSGSYFVPKDEINGGNGNMEPFATNYKIIVPETTTPSPPILTEQDRTNITTGTPLDLPDNRPNIFGP